jgi:vacuolar protein sorting-associated protein 52
VTVFYVQEAGTEGGKAQLHFEEILKSNIAVYVVSSN